MIDVVEITDPGCIWSWGSVEKLARLRAEYDGVRWRRVLGVPGPRPGGPEEQHANWLEVVRDHGRARSRRGSSTCRRARCRSRSRPARPSARARSSPTPCCCACARRRSSKAARPTARERIREALATRATASTSSACCATCTVRAITASVLADKAETRRPPLDLIASGVARADGDDFRYPFPTLIINGRILAGWTAVRGLRRGAHAGGGARHERDRDRRRRPLRAAMGHFATGVTVVTAAGGDGRRHGSTANAVASVSLEPPLLLVCLREQSLTLAALLDAGRFAVNVLHQRQRELAQRFARRGATWEDVAHRDGLLDGAIATLDVRGARRRRRRRPPDRRRPRPRGRAPGRAARAAALLPRRLHGARAMIAAVVGSVTPPGRLRRAVAEALDRAAARRHADRPRRAPAAVRGRRHSRARRRWTRSPRRTPSCSPRPSTAAPTPARSRTCSTCCPSRRCRASRSRSSRWARPTTTRSAPTGTCATCSRGSAPSPRRPAST